MYHSKLKELALYFISLTCYEYEALVIILFIALITALALRSSTPRDLLECAVTSPKAVYFVASGSTMYVMDTARVTQPDIGPGTSFTDKHSNCYILQSLMKIDASVEVKVPQLKKKKERKKTQQKRKSKATERKIFLHDQKKSRKSFI